ncbi:YARHG domain-containing protein [Flammeovirga aprica]|uniref:YARHG domain-containing protein n=1 Tax=Flammeovirga aprica JL-4 TaxID=694437 RepID=A0A7X9XBV1_9BACT|nr:YARHG domain-containing protein [Flammeovirga aprica]NME71068.1 YARHG domain-containing protein [Flammeovirga aprica JL-4]
MNSQTLSKKVIYFWALLLIAGCSATTQKNSQSNEIDQQQVANVIDQQPVEKFRVDKEYYYYMVQDFDSADFRIKRNEIYAQYGYKFKSQELTEYFSQFSWYNPTEDNVDSLLTELDLENIKFLQKYEAIFKIERQVESLTIENNTAGYPLSEFDSIYRLGNSITKIDHDNIRRVMDLFLGKLLLYPNIDEIREKEAAQDSDERFPLEVYMTRPIQITDDIYLCSAASLYQGIGWRDYAVYYAMDRSSNIIDTIRFDGFKCARKDVYIKKIEEETNLHFYAGDEIFDFYLDAYGMFHRSNNM